MAVPLPNVGTEFVSLKAFKLSVHKSALAHGLEMKTDSAHQRHADMICRLESGPPSKAGGLILNPTTSGKGFAVSLLTDRTHLYLQCTRNQAKYASSDVGRCGAYLEANERNGQWHVTSVNHKHNHGVSALRQPKPGKRTKLVVEVDSFDEEETESNAAFSFPQPSSSRFFDERSTTTTAFRSKPPPATGSASNPLFQRSTSSLFCHSAQQPPGPPFEVELVAFLCHTLTSPPAATTEEPLETLAAFLLSLGLSSVSDLAAFFLLPNALLDATIESSKAVKIGEVSAEVLFELGRLVGRARREMAAA
ncbi:hypothetical protein JCM8097_005528 [Rhodosporidiobolus ruineniae]